MIFDNQKEMKTAQESGDIDKAMLLQKEQIILNQIVSSLSKPSGRIIIN